MLLFFRWGKDENGDRTKAKWAQMCLCDEVPELIREHVAKYQC